MVIRHDIFRHINLTPIFSVCKIIDFSPEAQQKCCAKAHCIHSQHCVNTVEMLYILVSTKQKESSNAALLDRDTGEILNNKKETELQYPLLNYWIWVYLPVLLWWINFTGWYHHHLHVVLSDSVTQTQHLRKQDTLTQSWLNVCSMLPHRLRRWVNKRLQKCNLNICIITYRPTGKA